MSEAAPAPGVVLYLFDDARARNWAPFALTRPIGELLHGCLLQRERAVRYWGVECAGHVSSPHLAGFDEPGAPPVVSRSDIRDDRFRIVFSSRAVPDARPPDLDEVDQTTPLRIGDTVVGWALPAGAELPSEERLLEPGRDDEGAVEISGSVVEWPWDMVAANGARLNADFDHLFRGGDAFHLSGVHVLGEHSISLGEDAVIEPGVVLDLRDGPVRLDDGVRVEAPARLAGPLYVGRDTVLLGGSISECSIGPVCKVRGEIETSVVLGHSNKAHDGFMGHAYLGRWVNLGALTTNSDLKNSYSPVRVSLGPGAEHDTGLLKVGSFLGDHVKTGIGTLLNTGTVLGAGSNVFGGDMPPKYVPPFSWGRGDRLGEYRLDKFLEVAEAAMARREVALGAGMREVLERAWERSGPERE